jgi:hypothetical protein
MYMGQEQAVEVTVLGHRFTPQGLVYDLQPISKQPGKWVVRADLIQPIAGVTTLQRFNVMSGEVLPLEPAAEMDAP